MNREEFIKLFKLNQHNRICYNFFIEKGDLKINFEDFNRLFNMYCFENRHTVEYTLRYFANKFEITLMMDLKTNKIIDIW